MDIKDNIKEYMKDRRPEERYASFDYCYNYFQGFYEKEKIKSLAIAGNIEFSSLHIGFYLASWGMLRGSSFLLQKSIKHYERLIKVIAETDRMVWEIDIDNYSDENIELLIKTSWHIRNALGDSNDYASDTLVTKIRH